MRAAPSEGEYVMLFSLESMHLAAGSSDVGGSVRQLRLTLLAAKELLQIVRVARSLKRDLIGGGVDFAEIVRR